MRKFQKVTFNECICHILIIEKYSIKRNHNYVLVVLDLVTVEYLMEWTLLLLFELIFNWLRSDWCQRHVVHFIKIRIKSLAIDISLRNRMKLLWPLTALIDLMERQTFISQSCMDVAYWTDLRILSTSNIVIVQWARILLINPLLRLPVISC